MNKFDAKIQHAKTQCTLIHSFDCGAVNEK